MREVHFDINLDDIFLIDNVSCTLTYCALNWKMKLNNNWINKLIGQYFYFVWKLKVKIFFFPFFFTSSSLSSPLLFLSSVPLFYCFRDSNFLMISHLTQYAPIWILCRIPIWIHCRIWWRKFLSTFQSHKWRMFCALIGCKGKGRSFCVGLFCFSLIVCLFVFVCLFGCLYTTTVVHYSVVPCLYNRL